MNRRELERYVDNYIERQDLPTMIERHTKREDKTMTLSLMAFENSVVARQLLQQKLQEKGYNAVISQQKDRLLGQTYYTCVISIHRKD
jgi:hypothetical protein